MSVDANAPHSWGGVLSTLTKQVNDAQSLGVVQSIWRPNNIENFEDGGANSPVITGSSASGQT